MFELQHTNLTIWLQTFCLGSTLLATMFYALANTAITLVDDDGNGALTNSRSRFSAHSLTVFFQKLTKTNLAATLVTLAAVAGTIANTLALLSGQISAPLLIASCLQWITLLAHVSWRFRSFGVLLMPISSVILIGSAIGERNTAWAQAAASDGYFSVMRTLHIVMATLGEVCAIAAFGVAVIYLWQHDALKKKNLARLRTGVPGLRRLGELLSQFLWLGGMLFTVGLISGALFSQIYLSSSEIANDLQDGRYIAPTVYKITWATAVWLWYLITLFVMKGSVHPSLRAAKMSTIGFILLASAYFGLIFFNHTGGAS